MKAHIGVDSKARLIHSIAVTPANIHDSQALEDLLHGSETRVWGDSAYAGQKDKLTEHAPEAKGSTPKKVCRNRQLTGQEPSANRYKSGTRARVKHVFGVMKLQFDFNKVRSRT